MTTSSCQLQINRLTNLPEEDLTELERQWTAQGKSASRKRYLRYYYRNREKYLIKRFITKKTKRGETTSRSGTPDDYIEIITITSGLIV